MTIRFEQLEKEWVALCDEWYLPSPAGQAWIASRRGWGVTAAIVLLGVLERFGVGVLSFAIVVSLELAWRLSLPGQVRRLYRRYYHQRVADVGVEAAVTIDERGLRMWSRQDEYLTVWSRVEDPVVTPSLIVFGTARSCVMVPRSAFADPAEMDAFLSAARAAKAAA